MIEPVTNDEIIRVALHTLELREPPDDTRWKRRGERLEQVVSTVLGPRNPDDPEAWKIGTLLGMWALRAARDLEDELGWQIFGRSDYRFEKSDEALCWDDQENLGSAFQKDGSCYRLVVKVVLAPPPES